MNRLEPLDWLRGLLALSIMLYHLTSWTLHAPDASETLGRLGVYGVSMFFTLSGLSMAVVYAEFIRDGRSAVRFYVRRLFRIWPLLWLAVIAVTLGDFILKDRAVDWMLVFLNLTTLFGFVSPGSYINTGAWSIGNEMVYYALTPALLALYRQRTLYGNVAVAASIAVGLYFGFFAITVQSPLAGQWSTYVHPLNNLLFFTAGVAMYFNLKDLDFSPGASWALLLASATVFVAYPARGDLVQIVTGLDRIVFFLASVALVLSFYKLRLRPPPWVSRRLGDLGLATYGVYLLHPIVFPLVRMAAHKLPWMNDPYALIVVTVMLTIVVSLALYKRFEEPLIRLGKRLTSTSPATKAESKVQAACKT